MLLEQRLGNLEKEMHRMKKQYNHVEAITTALQGEWSQTMEKLGLAKQLNEAVEDPHKAFSHLMKTLAHTMKDAVID